MWWDGPVEGEQRKGKTHSEKLSLSAGCSHSEPSLLDVQVSEVVKRGPEGPARLHVVYLLGQLWDRDQVRPGTPATSDASRSDRLTCSTVLSLKPKPSFSRQVMYVMSMQRKGLMARYLVILLHTANTQTHAQGHVSAQRLV